jgi:hypothetical protein
MRCSATLADTYANKNCAAQIIQNDRVRAASADNTSPRHLVLTMMHLGRGSSAVLCCDDEEKVIPRLFEILKGCVGWEISRIGDLDVEL